MAKKKTVKSKIVKKKLAGGTENKNEMVSKNDLGEEVLTTRTVKNGKTIEIKRKHIDSFYIQPVCIAGPETIGEEADKAFTLKFGAIRAAIQSDSKDLQNEAISAILGDLVVGAYQDKLLAYATSVSENNKNNVEAWEKIQKQRQAADTHLLNIIKAIRDIKRPPVNVVVKQAEQVNVAEQISQAEQQVNIGKYQQANINPNKPSA